MPDRDIRNDFSIETVKDESRMSAQDYYSRVQRKADGLGNLTQQIARYTDNNSAMGLYRFPSNVGKYYMTMQISEYSRNNLFTVNFQTKDTIVLPMPDKLLDPLQVNYSEEAIGTAVGAMANKGIEEVENLKNRMASAQSPDGLQSTLESIGKDIFSSGEGAVGLAKTAVTGLAGGAIESLADTRAGRAAQALAGYSPNQFFTVLLKAPNYKQYNFTWALLPKNRRESEEIKNIANLLKNSMSPGLAAGGMLWSFPKLFRLAYYPNSQYLYKFKPSVLMDLQVNYAPHGINAFYHDDRTAQTSGNGAITGGNRNPSAPESVTISATFKEIEYWLDGDFIDDNQPYNTRGTER